MGVYNKLSTSILTMSITINVCESVTSACGEVYLMQHYIINFVSDLQIVFGFHGCSQVFFINKTGCREFKY